MDKIPWGTILEIIVIDVALMIGFSVLAGIAVARAAGVSTWRGTALGVLLPVAGPAVWAVVVAARDRQVLGAARVRSRGPALWFALGAIILAALLMAVAWTQPWGSVEGALQGSTWDFASRPSDDPVSTFATLGTAALLLLVGAVAAVWTAWRRIAVVAAGVAALWAMLVLDTVLVMGAAEDISGAVDGLSDGRAAATVSLGAALWLILAAAVLLALSAGTLLTVRRPEPVSAVAGGSWDDGWSSTPATVRPLDYGDGF